MDSLEQLETAERVIEEIAAEAKLQGLVGRPWHGPRQSRCYVSRDGIEIGYIEVERDGHPPATSLRVNNFYLAASNRALFDDLTAQAEKLINDDVGVTS